MTATKNQASPNGGFGQRGMRFLLQSWKSFSYVGLVFATLFFATSLSPSLLPRNYMVQGLLSGLALAVGYGLGVAVRWLCHYLELPQPRDTTDRIIKWFTTVAVVAAMILSLWRATVWQNSIRGLMEMEPLQSAYPTYVALFAVGFGVLLIGCARLLRICGRLIDKQLSRILPRRVANVLSFVLVGLLVLLVTNKLIVRRALAAADKVFLEIDQRVDDGLEQPLEATAVGSSDSLIEWDSIGRQGRDFIATGPTQKQLSEFSGREAMQPLRVYVGLGCRETAAERAELALEELKRVGGFERSLLVVATPTGTGWLDPGAVDTLEYLHAGDTAIVSLQYSYLPSWITILVEPDSSRDAANILFNAIYGHWRSLPRNQRPRLYLHGLSLGALGSETSADLFTLFEDPIDGGLWSGPPFSKHGVGFLDRSAKSGLSCLVASIPRRIDGSIYRTSQFTSRSWRSLGANAFRLSAACQRPDDFLRARTSLSASRLVGRPARPRRVAVSEVAPDFDLPADRIRLADGDQRSIGVRTQFCASQLHRCLDRSNRSPELAAC